MIIILQKLTSIADTALVFAVLKLFTILMKYVSNQNHTPHYSVK